jgi:hypothetical protein
MWRLSHDLPTLQQQLQPRSGLPGEEGEMSDDLVKHCMCGCMYLEAECPNCNKITDADRIEALTEQLEAARADAKEAEAYAEELAGDQVDLCRQLIAAEDKLAKATWLLTEAAVQLEEGKIKTRRNRAAIIWNLLDEMKADDAA